MTNSFAAGKLKSGVDRVERIQGEIDALNLDKAEIYKELRDDGFNTKVLKKVVTRRKKDKSDVMEEDALLELYEGTINGTKAEERDPLD